jgi:hypothetical protein
MSKITKGNLVILAVLLALFNLESRADDKQEAEAQTKVENPYDGARVLVEALLVEVNLDALEKAGMGPLSKERPTASKILAIIRDKNAGRIQTTEKLAIVNPGEGRMEASGQIKVPLNREPNSPVKSWQQYDTGSTVNINLEIHPDGRIWLSFVMALNIIGNDPLPDNQPPEVLRFSWRSTVTLRSGIPIIASGLEGKGKMVYLILRADIEEDSLSQSLLHKK